MWLSKWWHFTGDLQQPSWLSVLKLTTSQKSTMNSVRSFTSIGSTAWLSWPGFSIFPTTRHWFSQSYFLLSFVAYLWIFQPFYNASKLKEACKLVPIMIMHMTKIIIGLRRKMIYRRNTTLHNMMLAMTTQWLSQTRRWQCPSSQCLCNHLWYKLTIRTILTILLVFRLIKVKTFLERALITQWLLLYHLFKVQYKCLGMAEIKLVFQFLFTRNVMKI